MQGFVLELARLEEVALSAYCENARQLGYTFVTLETLVDETERVYWLHQECRKRQPPLGTHQEPQDYALWLRTWAVPEAHPELYHVLRKHEEYIGVCGLVKTETAEEFICGVYRHSARLFPHRFNVSAQISLAVGGEAARSCLHQNQRPS